jgi:hypothetical protein
MTTATDEYEASSIFSAMSKTLSFTPPANAQTSLASLLNAQRSETASLNIPLSTGFDLGEISKATAATAPGSRLTNSATSRATGLATASLFSSASSTAITSSSACVLFVSLDLTLTTLKEISSAP